MEFAWQVMAGAEDEEIYTKTDTEREGRRPVDLPGFQSF